MKKGFSLLELLIVVAVLALLVSILLPSLSRARQRAKVAVCASQMKQISFAMVTYTTNNRSYFPVNTSLGTGGEITWDDKLSKYDGREVEQARLNGWIPHSDDHKLYICPADKSNYHSARHKRSYSLTHGHKRARSSKRGIVQATNTADWSQSILKISEPYDTLAMVENHQASNKLGCNSQDVTRIQAYQANKENETFWGHEMWRSNYLLIDSSVKYLTAEETFNNQRSIWGSENQVDTMWDSWR